MRRLASLSIVAMALSGAPAGSGQEKPGPLEPPSDTPWKEQIRLPQDPFLIPGTAWNEPAWVKFTIVPGPDGRHKVYFQDGHRYRFHYPFATEHLEPFQGMTAEQFDRATLYRQGRQAVLGAVITPPLGAMSSYRGEYGIQLVGSDPYLKEEVAAWFQTIRQAVLTTEEYRAFYLPTYEQRAAAEADAAWLREQGIEIGSTGRWADGNTCYASGWALGTLKYFAGDAIRAAYLRGELQPHDILLTDGVPAETPFLAGILTLSPSTPNSHVAILAKSSGVPFAHLALAQDANRARDLVGHRIVLRAYDVYGQVEVRLIDLEGIVDDATIGEILTLKEPPRLNIAPVAPFGSYAMITDALLPADIRHFGGKAANYGILRRAIPAHAPVAVAISFDLWNDFLSQPRADGRTLRATIAARLAPFSYPPANMAALSDALDDIRDLIEDGQDLDFTEAQKQSLLAILQDPQYGFDPRRNLRFRSSTNVEDGPEFTGAGLYESYSGCLADELDGDTDGPCLCNPDRSNERGVFTVIRKVFASFYNENAYLERLRHGAAESDVGMALLVHHSFPDPFELANGVALVRRDAPDSAEIRLVTQLGAVSVTNPAGGSTPEEVVVNVSSFGTYAEHLKQSDLVQLGATVMRWQEDYLDLAKLLTAVSDEFTATTGKTSCVLEMEYKKIADATGGANSPSDGRLVVKQVREVPQPESTPSIVPFLIDEPMEYRVYQGEFGNVFANHRLKSRWQLQTGSFRLTPQRLRNSLYEQVMFEYLADDGTIGRLAGRIADWPQAAHDFTQPTATQTWRLGALENPRRYTLYTNNIPTLVSPAESAVLTLRDFGDLTLEVEYEQPVVQWDWTGPTHTTRDEVRLRPAYEPSPDDLLQNRRFDGPGGVSVEISFSWPPAPKGPTAGYTAPLARWVETRITGYTSAPIVLRGDYSQTYRPEHHNFSEHFLFEPQLEPGLSAATLAELREKEIRWIHVYGGLVPTTITTYDFHGRPNGTTAAAP